jgi:hypothetical protein
MSVGRYPSTNIFTKILPNLLETRVKMQSSIWSINIFPDVFLAILYISLDFILIYWKYRVSQKDVYTRLILRIIMYIHLFGIPCINLFVHRLSHYRNHIT